MDPAATGKARPLAKRPAVRNAAARAANPVHYGTIPNAAFTIMNEMRYASHDGLAHRRRCRIDRPDACRKQAPTRNRRGGRHGADRLRSEAEARFADEPGRAAGPRDQGDHGRKAAAGTTHRIRVSSALAGTERERQLLAAGRHIHFSAVEARARPWRQRARGGRDRPAIDDLPGARLELRLERRH
jgi:hypothetical protein